MNDDIDGNTAASMKRDEVRKRQRYDDADLRVVKSVKVKEDNLLNISGVMRGDIDKIMSFRKHLRRVKKMTGKNKETELSRLHRTLIQWLKAYYPDHQKEFHSIVRAIESKAGEGYSVINPDGSVNSVPSALLQGISLLQGIPRMSVIQLFIHSVAHGLPPLPYRKVAQVLADLFDFKVVVDPSATNSMNDGIYLTEDGKNIEFKSLIKRT
jgi:hypothetical protein